MLDGGQAFRWNHLGEGVWEGSFGPWRARLRSGRNQQVQWCGPRQAVDTLEPALRHYLALDSEQDALRDNLPWRSDPILAKALGAFPGLRILRQPVHEALFGFLCSANKRIPQIKEGIARVAREHGVSTPTGGLQLPTWESLGEMGESPLRACRLGYRAKSIHGTALFLSQNPGWLEEAMALPAVQCRDRLCQLPGVGVKIADCVRLFGGAHYDAFPIDTWILRVMRELYGLEEWQPSALQTFARIHFGEGAGIAQQYLFAYARSLSRSQAG